MLSAKGLKAQEVGIVVRVQHGSPVQTKMGTGEKLYFFNVLHQLPALELRRNLAEDTALNLQDKSAANCGSTECAGSAVFAV